MLKLHIPKGVVSPGFASRTGGKEETSWAKGRQTAVSRQAPGLSSAAVSTVSRLPGSPVESINRKALPDRSLQTTAPTYPSNIVSMARKTRHVKSVSAPSSEGEETRGADDGPIGWQVSSKKQKLLPSAPFSSDISGSNFQSRTHRFCLLLHLGTKSVQNPSHIACLLRIWMQPQELL